MNIKHYIRLMTLAERFRLKASRFGILIPDSLHYIGGSDNLPPPLSPEKELIVFMHFPVVFGDKASLEILEVLKKHGIKRCYYGHVHGTYDIPAVFTQDEITFTITSADFLNFVPKIVN